MEQLRARKGFLCDMDGVIYHGEELIPGAKDFVDWLIANDKKFLFLTNASDRSPKELAQKLYRLGLDVGEEHFYTSALATARFLRRQAPGCSAYVVGGPGLYNALYDAGITMNNVDPDYVVIGETNTYSYEHITTAMNLVNNGARLIATNRDMTTPVADGMIPACKAFVAPIELTTGKKAYYMGKPNPLMMHTGLHILGLHADEAVMIGDRMDTDMIAGIETGLDTALVLSGASTRDTIEEYPYRPRLVINSVGDIPG
ncbi:MAG: HAD-IIA family hydrolase [Clostridia bacterium]|nr:HAD-IIA family hydrolase [Clostridia bacterium]